MKIISFFPTPYPDELLYSVIARYHMRNGSPTLRATCNELYGRRMKIPVNFPTDIDTLASRIPEESEITVANFIERNTVFPYFSPFLTKTRSKAFLTYMRQGKTNSQNTYFALGIGKLRYPTSIFLRFCKGCWSEDVKKYGEPYWHRLHQIPGVFMCHHHGEPLYDSKVSIAAAKEALYAATVDMTLNGAPCGNFTDIKTEKLIKLSENSEWLLNNGLNCGSYEETLERYDLFYLKKGFRTTGGKTNHQQVFDAIRQFYGNEFLQLLNADIESAESAWMARITHYPNTLIHPMNHALMIGLLAGSAASFFTEDCEKTLPFGNPPWPCRNVICPYYLKDVIKEYEPHYKKGYYHARFKCPHCGMVYRRKKAISKEKQYSGKPYIEEYGFLWESKLRECLVQQKLSPRRTCNLLHCDFYTVNKYAVRLGILSAEDVTFPSKREVKPKKVIPIMPILSDDEKRQMYRERWLKLMADNPKAIRSKLLKLDGECYVWLRKNDTSWYEENSPAARFAYMDWEQKDIENLEKVQNAIETLRTTEGKPRWISKSAVMKYAGVYRLNDAKIIDCLPKTMKYLNENIESVVEWRKSKIIWAIHKLLEKEKCVSLNKIKIYSAITNEKFEDLKGFVLECMKIE